MDVLQTLKKCMQLLRINEDKGGYSVPVCTYIFLQVAMAINIIFFLVTKWENIDDRVAAIRSLAFLTAFFSYTITLVNCWDEFSPMLSNLRNMHYQLPYKITRLRNDTCMDLYTEMRKYNNLWKVMVVAYWLCTIFVPITTVTMKIILYSADFHELIKENSAVPFPVYYPECAKYFHEDERFTNLMVYIIGYTSHSIYILFTGIYAQFVYITTLSAIANVEFELKLLAVSFIEMDESVAQKSKTTNYAINGDTPARNSLDGFLKYAVKHHQDIHKRFDKVNKGVRWVAFTLCTVASIIICTSIYTVVQKDQLILKLQEGVYSCVWVVGVFLFEFTGEKVITQNENLRVALYESAWLDKPNWFKKSLAIIMTRACRSFEIKPFGLYGFNHNNFALIMNAAYCYYNLFCRFKNQT